MDEVVDETGTVLVTGTVFVVVVDPWRLVEVVVELLLVTVVPVVVVAVAPAVVFTVATEAVPEELLFPPKAPSPNKRPKVRRKSPPISPAMRQGVLQQNPLA